MPEFIPLCVPKEKKDIARKAGARWDPDARVWECDRQLTVGPAYDRLRPFVPLMYRPDRPPPHIRPMMVPQTSWGRNLRAVLSKENWDIVRRGVYQAAGYRCRICGGKGDQWPVEADELWTYDDQAGVQTLVNVIAMCPWCHLVHHWGRATTTGQEDQALAQMMFVNGWTEQDAAEAGEAGFSEWQRRSQREWRIDYSWALKRFTVQLEPDADQRARAANRSLVSTATRQADEQRAGSWIANALFGSRTF